MSLVPTVHRALSSVHRNAGALVNRQLHRGTFRLDGRDFPYVVHPYNPTWRNERIVELAVARDALERHRGERILEVGHVMGHYGHVGHDVVDLYERAPGVHNVDIVAFDPAEKYDLIVTVSTLEHVGFDEDGDDEPDKPVEAVGHLKRLLRPGGELCATVPLGYNQQLDRRVRADALGFDRTSYLKRTSQLNRWQQVGVDEVRKARYGVPFPAANVIAVGTYILPAR